MALTNGRARASDLKLLERMAENAGELPARIRAGDRQEGALDSRESYGYGRASAHAFAGQPAAEANGWGRVDLADLQGVVRKGRVGAQALQALSLVASRAVASLRVWCTQVAGVATVAWHSPWIDVAFYIGVPVVITVGSVVWKKLI